MDADKLIIAIMVFSVFIVGGTLFLTDINDNYEEVNLDTTDLGGVLDTGDKIYNLSEDMTGFVTPDDFDDDDTENSMFKGVYSALILMTTPISLMGDIAQAIATVIPIPKEFIAFAISIVGILVVFALIYIIFRIGRG